MIAMSSRPSRSGELERRVTRTSRIGAVASCDLYPAPRWTLEYEGRNSSTRPTTEPRAPVEAAASSAIYGRSRPSTHGTSIPSPTNGTGGLITIRQYFPRRCRCPYCPVWIGGAPFRQPSSSRTPPLRQTSDAVTSAASGKACAFYQLTRGFVVSVSVAPDDVGADHRVLLPE